MSGRLALLALLLALLLGYCLLGLVTAASVPLIRVMDIGTGCWSDIIWPQMCRERIQFGMPLPECALGAVYMPLTYQLLIWIGLCLVLGVLLWMNVRLAARTWRDPRRPE